MKSVGAVMIIMTCVMLGQYLSKGLIKRVRQLEAACIMISMVRTRLQYSYCPVVELVEELALREDLSNLKFIKKCVQNCKESVDFPVAWRESLSDKMNVDALKPMDIESLIAFGETLGTTAIEGQLACCDLYKSIIDENLSSARLDMKKYSKLFPALGTLMGIGISVIVI